MTPLNKVAILESIAKARSTALDQYLKINTGDKRSDELAKNAAKAWEDVAEAHSERLPTPD